MNRQEWINKLFQSIDEKDTDYFVSFLTDDCELIFGNAPSVKGKDAIHAVISGFLDSIKVFSHTLPEWI